MNFHEMDDHELDAALRAVNPVTRVEVDDLGAAALFEQMRNAHEGPVAFAATRRVSRRRLAIASVAGAAVLGLAIPAAAAMFDAQTGEFPPLVNEDGTVPTETDGTEWIDLAAADFVEYTASIYPYGIAVPAGVDPDDVRVALATELTEEARSTVSPSGATGGVMQVTGLVASFEYTVRCLWIDDYLEAVGTDDGSRRAHAAGMLRESTTWPAIVATDGGNVVEGLSAQAAAAENGDVDTVQREFDINCDTSLEDFRG